MKDSRELKIAIAVAKAVGKIQTREFEKTIKKPLKNRKSVTKKTKAKCEKAIKKILQKKFPKYLITTEGKKISSTAMQWIVDPLNAITMYSYGAPCSSVLIALQKKQEIVLGVLYHPFQKILITAVKNKGAFLNDKKIHVSSQKNLKKSHLAYNGINYPLQKHTNGLKKLFSMVQSRSSLPWIETIIQVCQGNADISLGGKGTPWEFTAPKIIVEEAGGIFSDYSGKKTLNKISAPIATNRALHKKIIKIMKK